jgi:decaprenylphospho-beta-D-ribofuranose 2-oxidase
MILSGWGRYPRIECNRVGVRSAADALGAVARLDSAIARGNGRSYGDPALNPAAVLDMRHCDRILAFDRQTGRITCEAGLMLSDLLTFAVPRGFFPPVTPGTKFVTIGGMIAADVHGKNHHRAGTFGRHVEALSLLCADGVVRQCSRSDDADLFHATCGGMGLTGIILDATFRMLAIETPLIRQETLKAANLDEAMAHFETSAGWTYTVAWIDCMARGKGLGRALVYRGEHATAAETGSSNLAIPHRRARRVPVDLPAWVLNRWSIAGFNTLYFHRGKPGTTVIDYDRYFYPLDAIHDWNRIYGRRGFVQYQCVLPKDGSYAGLEQLLERISAAGRGSFLAVLKLFGPAGDGFLSFPMEGYTLALDFPADRETFDLFIELDRIVTAHGGRVYLAKDACSGPEMLRQGYPNLDRFRSARAHIDPSGKFTSLQSQRLGL